MSPNEPSKSQPGLPVIPNAANATAKHNVSIPLRPLAPKIVPRFRPLAIKGSSDGLSASSQAKQVAQDRGWKDNRCAVCFKRNCSLVSHKLRNDTTVTQRHQKVSDPRPPTSQESFAASYALNMATLYDNLSPGHTNSGLLDQLTIPPGLDRSRMHHLFHSWFVVEAPKHFTVPRPAQMKSDLLHSPFMAPAFTDPVLCLSILTISAATQRQTPSNPSNVLALTLFDEAMRKLRERVNANRDTVTDTTIAAATYLWAANLYLTNDESLQQHASSVRALIDVRKDVSDSGLSEAVAILFEWVDIMNTLRLNRASQFPHDRRLKVPQMISPQSGKAWLPGELQQIPTSDQAVLDMSSHCCRAIDLLDQTPSEEMDAETYTYLFYRAAQLYQESSKLRATYCGSGTMEECVVLAVDILKLIVFNGGCNESGRPILKLQARYLSTAIQATGGGNLWRTQIHLFIWLVFLVYVAKPAAEYQEWSVLVLRGALEHVFGQWRDWSDDTFDQLQKLLFTFGWSHSAPLADLESFCEQLWA